MTPLGQSPKLVYVETTTGTGEHIRCNTNRQERTRVSYKLVTKRDLICIKSRVCFPSLGFNSHKSESENKVIILLTSDHQQRHAL